MSLAGSIEETNAMVAKGEHYEALQLYSRLVKGLEQKGDHGEDASLVVFVVFMLL
jgi:hypothetical protein